MMKKLPTYFKPKSWPHFTNTALHSCLEGKPPDNYYIKIKIYILLFSEQCLHVFTGKRFICKNNNV